MQEPTVVLEDFGKLVAEYPTTPIYFAECGYSSSTFCNSSEEKQAQFYKEVFRTWDSFSTQISVLTVFKSNDWSKQEVNGLAAFYGINDTIFKEYLRTLGVRNWEGSGSNKLGYEQILCELESRNWCGSAKCQLTGTKKRSKAEMSYSIYPNPNVTEHITIKGFQEGDWVEVFNAQGKKVLESKTANIETKLFKNGLYFVKIYPKNGVVTTLQFIKLAG